MVRIFSDFDDVRETRERADIYANTALEASGGGHLVPDVLRMLDAIRFEIRAAAQLISAAVGAALEQQGGR